MCEVHFVIDQSQCASVDFNRSSNQVVILAADPDPTEKQGTASVTYT